MSGERETIERLVGALRRITAYDSPDKLRRSSEKQWGLPFEEAMEMAYDNIQQEARSALRGVRIQRAKKVAAP